MKHNIQWFSEGIIEICLDILLSLNTHLNLATYFHSFYLTNFLVFMAGSSVNEGPVLSCSETVFDSVDIFNQLLLYTIWGEIYGRIHIDYTSKTRKMNIVFMWRGVLWYCIRYQSALPSSLSAGIILMRTIPLTQFTLLSWHCNWECIDRLFS